MDSFRYTMQSSCHAAGGDEGAICSFDMKKGCVNAPHSKIRTADGVEYCNAPKRERKHVFGPVFSSKHDQTIVLPRQARDKHREDSKTKTVFQACASRMTSAALRSTPARITPRPSATSGTSRLPATP